jgi:pimeloyl-ACP methyl ester carboxylesterase
MANFVLVHGAWHGGWCYRHTARMLRAMGHTVATPTHTGVGERAHQAHESITLETHIRDVVGAIEAEELDDVVLCGHSYGGMVITGVADRMAGRIRSLVYLDAFVPRDGDSLIRLFGRALPPEVAQVFIGSFRGTAQASHCGMMSPIPAEMFNIAARNRAWVDRRCAPQALATFEMPLLLSGGGLDSVRSRHYVLADGWDPSPFRHFAAQCEREPGWTVSRLACSHDVMVDMPEELANLLARIA